MPCTMRPEEIEYYERTANEKIFGEAMTDAKLLEEVACQATTYMYKNKLLDDAPLLVKRWFLHHAKKDTFRARLMANPGE